jgi:hypothetical protein
MGTRAVVGWGSSIVGAAVTLVGVGMSLLPEVPKNAPLGYALIVSGLLLAALGIWLATRSRFTSNPLDSRQVSGPDQLAHAYVTYVNIDPLEQLAQPAVLRVRFSKRIDRARAMYYPDKVRLDDKAMVGRVEVRGKRVFVHTTQKLKPPARVSLLVESKSAGADLVSAGYAPGRLSGG